MNQLITTGIILTRTDFGEADRILTILTPEYGKLRLIAKGVRRVKSKLAGGIELFSISDLTFIRGRGEVGTLVSARLKRHYAHIVEDLPRAMVGYDLIKQLHKTTEDEPEMEYFALLQSAFEALDNHNISCDLIRIWFISQLLKLAGHTPNFQTDDVGKKLSPEMKYKFSFETMAFKPATTGRFDQNHIKILRILFSANPPHLIAKVRGSTEFLSDLAPLIQSLSTAQLHA